MRNPVANEALGNTVMAQVRTRGGAAFVMVGKANLRFFTRKSATFRAVTYFKNKKLNDVIQISWHKMAHKAFSG